MVEAAARLLDVGIRPPLFRAGNVEGADTHNQALWLRYHGRVFPLI